MNSSERKYSPFWPILLFFAVVLIFDLDQTVKLHRKKIEVMQQYARTIALQSEAQAKTKWILALREDLLKLAPGDPEASRIVAELHLRPEKNGP